MISKRKKSILMNVYFLLTGIAVLILDQVTKHLVNLKIPGGTSIELIPKFLYFINIKNTGAAFGMFQSYTKVLIVISLVAIFLIIILKVMLNLDFIFYNISLGFILGGALGTLVDRYFMGEVTDFISFTIFRPVFNVADSFIFIGFILTIILVLREYIKYEKARGVEPKRSRRPIV
ncbi:MAG: signal peptidase II [Actinobacteria bacterium]|nr:signal peptidase II [Actinomycetota bacterium]